MKKSSPLLWLMAGLLAGVLGAALCWGPLKPAVAGNDRFEDYVLCTGPVGLAGRGVPYDGVWLLDYRAGKLLGSVVDRATGKVQGWAEVDLVTDFGIPPRQNVHFLMTTGNISIGQAALYVAETSTGKFGVYTLNPGGPQQPLAIVKHDLVPFRGFVKPNDMP